MNDSQEHILKIAFSLFIAKGYKAVTLNDLEKATKLTKGAFYHYFKNKEEIFQAVIKKYYLTTESVCMAEDSISMQNYINLNINCFQEKMESLREITGSQTPDPNYLSLIMEAKKYFPLFDEKIKGTFRLQNLQWVNILIKARENGEIKNNIDLQILAEIFTSIGLGIIRNLILDDTLEQSMTKLKLQYQQLYSLLQK